MIGSGNRPHPKIADYTDRFFMVKDRIPDETFTALKTVDIMDNITEVTETVIGDTGNSIFTTAADATCQDDICRQRQKNGWYLDLLDSGEKVLSSSLTFEGITTFTTYVPNIGQSLTCGPSEGVSYTYTVGMSSGIPLFGGIRSGRSEGRQITGAGIGSDPVVVSLDGSIFIGPGNLTILDREKDADVPNDQTFWYEENLTN